MHGPCNTIDGPRHSMACKTEPVVEFRGPSRRSSGKTPKTVRFRPSGWSSPNNFKPTDVDTEGRDTHDYARQARVCLKSFGSGHGCSATKPPITARCGATKAATSATVFETIRLRDGRLPAYGFLGAERQGHPRAEEKRAGHSQVPPHRQFRRSASSPAVGITYRQAQARAFYI